MASPFAQRIARIIKGNLTPLLKSHGFRKEGSVYVADHGDMAWLIDIQKSRWNDHDEAQFTVNGGVYVPGVVSVYVRQPDPAKPKIDDCCMSVRIGMLEESQCDKWWKVTADDDRPVVVDEMIATELRDWIENLLLPFLAKFESPVDIAEFLEQPTDASNRFVAPQSAAMRRAYASLIYARIGNADKARHAIEQAVHHAAGSPGAEFIQRLREKIVSV